MHFALSSEQQLFRRLVSDYAVMLNSCRVRPSWISAKYKRRRVHLRSKRCSFHNDKCSSSRLEIELTARTTVMSERAIPSLPALQLRTTGGFFGKKIKAIAKFKSALSVV